MARRIIQDVVFPSKRMKEGFKNVSGEIPGASSNSAPTQSRDLHDTVEKPPMILQSGQPENFLPRLIKKSYHTESNVSDFEHSRSGMSSRISNSNNVKKKSSHFVLWILAVVVIVGTLGVAFSTIFFGATIKIIPLNKSVSLELDIVARENTTEEGFVPYQKIPLPNEEMSEDIPATLEKEITKKASGTIKIYNEYSTASQRLIKNTRFESKSGKIYRIDNSIVVPGMSVAGGKTTPGSVEAKVYGDAPGEEYNSGPSDFTIPGFKGDPRYTKFYARSQTPLMGGFSGKVKVPSEEDQNKAVARLKESLRGELIKKARAQIPEGFILYDSTIFIIFNDLEAINPQNPTHITVKGSLYGVMFNRSILSGFIVKKIDDSYDGSPLLIRNIEELDVEPKHEILDPGNLKDISLVISGQASIVWDVDQEKLKGELTGVSKKDGFKNVISQYASIWKAEAVIQPFWMTNFPKNPKNITIVEALE
ncbi:MAG: hypothetical protein Q7S11_01990 [bacterium]|nr:hypothetical protein [bacterium]